VSLKRTVRLLEQLTGEPVPSVDRLGDYGISDDSALKGLGYSQLNELLLLAGLDRITHAFFAYLISDSTEYTPGMAIESFDQLDAGVTKFRKMALLSYGNIKFAFKSLSHDEDLLRADLASQTPIGTEAFEQRHAPLLPIQSISADESYLTGYLIEGELRSRLKSFPTDADALELERRRKEIVAVALRNQAAYLASDHLDVYVATSMRARQEFMAIGRVVKLIFEHESTKPLNLRWFDPTQAYCTNRIDKGLAEALMLRRASCTIYLAQESDTLGKDSELASTLAQGKPVIAFVPEVDAQYLDEHFQLLAEADPHKSTAEHLIDQLRLFDSGAAWLDPKVRMWCGSPESAPIEELKTLVHARIKAHYDGRALTLRETHPLGVQVNLGTGVANGVMVVRTSSDCAKLVRGIVTGTLTFELEENNEYTVLRETISKSIFRVMTRDAMLTNTFWNFYLDPAA
jgi:hypothetical protein